MYWGTASVPRPILQKKSVRFIYTLRGCHTFFYNVIASVNVSGVNFASHSAILLGSVSGRIIPCTHHTPNTSTCMTSLQRMCIHSFHPFSFFKHCKREKFKLIIIAYVLLLFIEKWVRLWGITHVLRDRLVPRHIANLSHHSRDQPRFAYRISHATNLASLIASVTRQFAIILITTMFHPMSNAF